jgi:hypothetical protein
MDFSHPTSCLPSLGPVLLPAPPAAHERHRYYEGSDSRRLLPGDGSPRLLRFAFPGECRAFVRTPFRPQPRNPSDGRFVSRLSAIGSSRLRLYPAGSPRVYAETGSCSYGLAVRLQLLPTPPLGDAVTFGYKVTTHSDRDFHPADKASSRTHWMPGTSPAMTWRGQWFARIQNRFAAPCVARRCRRVVSDPPEPAGPV